MVHAYLADNELPIGGLRVGVGDGEGAEDGFPAVER